jgi:hypothetical protein
MEPTIFGRQHLSQNVVEQGAQRNVTPHYGIITQPTICVALCKNLSGLGHDVNLIEKVDTNHAECNSQSPMNNSPGAKS